MAASDSAVIVLGVIVLLLGMIIVVGYYDARNRAQQTSQQREAFSGLEALAIMMKWMTDAFQLLILNLFVTGIAIIAAGVGLRRVNKLQATTTTSTSDESNGKE